MRGIISSKNSKGNCGNKIEKSIHISEEEEQILYYVAGFLFFFNEEEMCENFRKKFKKY